MRLRAISLVTLGVFAVACIAQADTITQYGLFPTSVDGSATGPVVTTNPSSYTQACPQSFGDSNAGSSGRGTGAACTNLANSPYVLTPDTTNLVETFAFQQFNVPNATLNSVTLLVYNYGYINSTATCVSPCSTLTYSMSNEYTLSLSPTQNDGVLTSPFYDDLISKTQTISGGDKYNHYMASDGTINETDYSTDNPNTTFTDNTTGNPNSNTQTLSNGAFEGSGTTDVYWGVQGLLNSAISGSGTGASSGFSDYVGTELILEYNYTPGSTIPEPGTLLLLGSGLTFAASRLRRRIAK